MHSRDKVRLVALSSDVCFVDYPGVIRLKGGVQVSELQKAKRRVKAIRAIRRSSELEGSRSTDATRADQVRYARGSITAAQLGDRIAVGITSSNQIRECRTPGYWRS